MGRRGFATSCFESFTRGKGSCSALSQGQIGPPPLPTPLLPSGSLTTLGARSVLPGSADLRQLCSVPSSQAWFVS